MPQKPVATFELPYSTGANVNDATTYKGRIDGDFAVLARIAGMFAPHANSTPDMRVYLDAGYVFDGTNLTEVGAITSGTVTNGSTSVAITGSVAGISGTMLVSGPGIPNGTTGTISGSTVTLSNAVSGLVTSPQTNAPLKFMQRTAAITAPVSNSRIDRIVIDAATGAVSVITGTASPTPSAPAITAGKIPVAQVLLTSATTAITNSMITDERAFNSLGAITATSGDVVISGAGAGATATIQSNAVTTSKVNAQAITYAKIQNVAANSFLGNNTNSSASPAEITLTASQLAGMGSSGSLAAITLGTGISMSGTTLNVSATTQNIQTFNSSGTWTKPAAGANAMALIECWGGGGGGSGYSNNNDSGGGGGSYSFRIVPLSSLGSTETVTVGGAGTGGGSGANGGNGGASSFGSWLTAYGGTGGGSSAGGAAGGVGSTASAGSSSNDSNLGNGGTVTSNGIGGYFSGGGGGSGQTASAGGSGGPSVYGGGGGGGASTSNGGTSQFGGNGGPAQNAGSQPGGGGGGKSSGTGGNGGAGRVKITVYN